MIAAVMQPYFFPYVGYFQLMQAVDVFVIYDDVQYINRGWVNRNRIRGSASSVWLTMPVQKASRDLAINQRYYAFSDGDAIRRIQQCLSANYARATFYSEAAPLISGYLGFGESNVSTFNSFLLMGLAKKFGITCRFLKSSEIDKPIGLRGQAKVIDLCHRIGATHYVNPIGGRELYDAASFDAAGLRLSFLRTNASPAKFAGEPQHLSIIDGLLREGVAGCQAQLPFYELLSNQ